MGYQLKFTKFIQHAKFAFSKRISYMHANLQWEYLSEEDKLMLQTQRQADKLLSAGNFHEYRDLTVQGYRPLKYQQCKLHHFLQASMQAHDWPTLEKMLEKSTDFPAGLFGELFVSYMSELLNGMDSQARDEVFDFLTTGESTSYGKLPLMRFLRGKLQYPKYQQQLSHDLVKSIFKATPRALTVVHLYNEHVTQYPEFFKFIKQHISLEDCASINEFVAKTTPSVMHKIERISRHLPEDGWQILMSYKGRHIN